ncbi:MAG: hypothetical protein ACYC0V_11860 [Armatimonadota bacterium]
MKIILLLTTIMIAASTACNAGDNMNNSNIMQLSSDSVAIGHPVDISPWIFKWRSDAKEQMKPEAYFLPRIIDRVNNVYRMIYHEHTYEERKSYYYNQKDLLMTYPQKPEGKLLSGALWVGGLNDFNLALVWPDGADIPSLDSIDVRIYPTSYGWFGWTVERLMGKPEISADKHTWIYKSDPSQKMDAEYSMQVPAATEVVAVYSKDVKAPVPHMKITGHDIGSWDSMNIEIEWRFQPGTEQKDFDGKVESFVAEIESITAFDDGTEVSGRNEIKSRYAGDQRRGVAMSVLYAPDSVPGFDSRITVKMGKGGFTFRLNDLKKGPIYLPNEGVFITKAGSVKTARQFVKELSDKKIKSFRQMTREHKEVQSWDELMKNVRFWQCPENTEVPPFPQVKDPAVFVTVPDQRWTDMWRTASNQLRGNHCWGMLGHEVGRVVRSMEFVGLHDLTTSVYDYFLQSPGVKPDGDYINGKGALEWAKSIKFDVGFSHEGTHSSTGRIMFAIAERYFLTGDRKYFQEHRARLQQAADWIIRERRSYMKDNPNRKDLFVAGLMPPQMLGDYSLPASDRRWFYCDNALAVQGLSRFAEALMDFDKEAGKKYLAEAKAFRGDVLKAVEKEALYAPVKRGSDGMYHHYIPRIAYNAGLSGIETGSPMFHDADMFWGALPLAEQFAVIDADDYCVVDTLGMMDDLGITNPEDGDIGAASAEVSTMPGQGGMSASENKRVSPQGKTILTYIDSLEKFEEKRKAKGISTDDAWFWKQYALMPKISHNASIFLLQDDVPNFLRFWMDSYAGLVAKDGVFWEWSTPNSYEVCTYPDTMSAGWFIENFRNMLMMEVDQTLWIARATPRVWLEQRKKITVSNAPTYFGDLAYEIVSDVDNGKITATIDIPNRRPIKDIIVRFRHPKSTPIRSVAVNGKPWKSFNPDKETIELKGLTGKVVVVASY